MRKITLTNFQSHKHSEIELSNTLTTISGKSDHGKSAIIRAIKWVNDNKPLGTSFIRHGTEKAEVQIDGVVHARTSSTNSYTVGGTTYKALRSAVPEAVTQALNLGRVNIQEQHNSIFLLGDAPGEVAQQLSALADLETTTKALSRIAEIKRNVSSDIKVQQERIRTINVALGELQSVEVIVEEWAKIEAQTVKIGTLHSQQGSARLSYEKARQEALALQKLPPDTLRQQAVRVAALLSTSIERKQTLADLRQTIQTAARNVPPSDPATLISQFKEIVEEKQIATHFRQVLQNAASNVPPSDPSGLLKKFNRLIQLRKQYTNLQNIVESINDAESALQKADIAYKKARQTKDGLFRDGCPVCGSRT